MSPAVENKARGRRVSARKEVTEQLRIRNSFERRLTFQMMTWYSDMAEAASREFSRNPTANVSIPQAERSLRAVLLPHYQAVIETMSKRFNTLQRKQEEPWNRFYREYIDTQGAEAVSNISASTRTRLKRVIQQGLDEGMGQAELARNIVNKFQPSFTRARAKVVARTETHSAASFANHKMAADIDVRLVKRWVATNDIRTRSHHAAANGQEVEMNEDFIVMTNGIPIPMGYTGDPRGGASNVINCRCITIYIEPDDVIVDDQPKPKPRTVDYGETDENELFAHNTGFSPATPAVFFTVIQRLGKARTDFLPNASSSHYSPVSNTIVMRNSKDDQVRDTRPSGTWRHEYGHFADFNTAEGGHKSYRPASRVAAPALLEDRKLYSTRRQEQAAERWNADDDDLIARNDGFRGVVAVEEVEALMKKLGFDEKDIDVLTNGRDWRRTKARSYGVWSLLKSLEHRYIYAFDNDYLNVRNAHPEKLNWKLADFLGSMSNRLVGWGHSYEYYQKFPKIRRGVSTGHTTEVMANYWALIGSKDHETWRKILKILAPESLKAMDDIVDRMAKGEDI